MMMRYHADDIDNANFNKNRAIMMMVMIMTTTKMRRMTMMTTMMIIVTDCDVMVFACQHE